MRRDISRWGRKMADEIFTIDCSRYNLKVEPGKLKGARIEWRAAGIVFYLRGSFKGGLYETAANIAMNMCLDRHIPAISLKRAR